MKRKNKKYFRLAKVNLPVKPAARTVQAAGKMSRNPFWRSSRDCSQGRIPSRRWEETPKERLPVSDWRRAVLSRLPPLPHLQEPGNAAVWRRPLSAPWFFLRLSASGSSRVPESGYLQVCAQEIYFCSRSAALPGICPDYQRHLS